MMQNTDTQTRNFLLTGKIEGYSYLVLLFIAMPIKYLFKMPQAVKVFGMVHGLLFVLFMLSIAALLGTKKLSFKGAFSAFFLSLIPFGTFYLGKLIKK
jgi:integral membrane protein